MYLFQVTLVSTKFMFSSLEEMLSWLRACEPRTPFASAGLGQPPYEEAA
jgi:hypothetical protein